MNGKKSGNNINCWSTIYVHDIKSHPSVISFNSRRWGQPLHVQSCSLHISLAFKITSAISFKQGLPNWQQTIKVNAFTICPLDSFTVTEIVLLWPWAVGAKGWQNYMVCNDKIQVSPNILLLTCSHLSCEVLFKFLSWPKDLQFVNAAGVKALCGTFRLVKEDCYSWVKYSIYSVEGN